MRLVFFALLALVAVLPTALATSVPDSLITVPDQDPAWRALFDQLASQKTRFSKFEERRTFPFRRTPVVLQGEIRIVPGRGLSLSYLGPSSHVVIVDTKGVLLRDEHGRERAAPSDRRADQVTAALFDVLRFDLPTLTREFVLHGKQTGENWVLSFDPKDPAVAQFVGSIMVEGHADQLGHIAMIKSEQQRIDIAIRETQNDVAFSPEELRRFFR